jgi:hypothetical protein
MTTAAEPAVYVPWDEHARYMAGAWKAGQHVSVIAQTGHGKTVLTNALLVLVRDERICTFDVKGDDPELVGRGTRVRKFPKRLARSLSVNHDEHYQLVLTGDRASSRAIAHAGLMAAYSEGQWVIVSDETRALTDPRAPNLGLAPDLEMIWMRGRSRKITLIAATQAPRWVPASMYDQPTYVYVSRLLDTRARKRIREIGGDTDRILACMNALKKFEFIFLTQDGEHCEIVKAPHR